MLSQSSLRDDFLPPALDAEARRKLWLQIVIVAGIAVAPDLCHATLALFEDKPPPYTILKLSSYLLMRSIYIIAALLGLLALVGERRESIGLGAIQKKDLLLTLLVFTLSLLMHYALAGSVYRLLGEPRQFSNPHAESWWDFALAAASHFGNGTAEELAIWGLLYTRIRRIWHEREVLSLVVAAGAFASYHIYQGAAPRR